MTRAHFTPKSSNAKTGPIPVTMTEKASCPSSCPFKANGCYAEQYPLNQHWTSISGGNKGRTKAITWDQLCDNVASLPPGQLWRHNQAGDLPGVGQRINRHELMQLVTANTGKLGFTYTHKPVDNRAGEYSIPRHNAHAVATANYHGFTINLSANNPAHADQLADMNIGPVVVVLPSNINGRATKTLKTPAGRTISICPATYRDDVTCESCRLCARKDRACVVGFPAHGAQKAKASRVVANQAGG